MAKTDGIEAWRQGGRAQRRGVRRWRLRVARRLLAAGVVLREPRSVVVRRLMRASLGQVQLVARVELTVRERSDAQGPVGLGLAGDAAMAGLAYASLGALVAVIAPVIRKPAITAITGLPAGRGPSNSSRNSGSAIPETLGGSRAITRERVAIPGSCSM